MQYQENFKQKVQLLLGNNEKINSMLNSGNEMIGRYLDDYRQRKISPDDIITAIESNNLQPLYEEAQKLKLADELYGEWIDQYRNQNQMHM